MSHIQSKCSVISEAVSHNYSLKSLSSFVNGLEKVYGEISSTVRNTSKIQMLCREEEEGLFFWLLNWVSTSVLQKYLDTVGKNYYNTTGVKESHFFPL